MSGFVIDTKRDVKMPSVGFGCAFGNWTNDKEFLGFQPDLGWKSVPTALRAGYRHFDCALVYGSHNVVGQSFGRAFADGIIERDDLFVCTKVFHPQVPLSLNTQGHAFPFNEASDEGFNVKDRIVHDVEKSLAELNLGYVDLVLLHWPGSHGTLDPEADEEAQRKAVEEGKRLRAEAWKGLEEMYKTGKVRAIGVSNFMERHFDFLNECEIKPSVNQIEINPYIQQNNVQDFCKKNDIQLVAWAPFGSGATGVLTDPAVKVLAEKYNKNAGQIILRWLKQKGIVSLPKSSNESRMKSNLDIDDFEMTADEIETINKLDQGKSSVTTSDSIA